MFPIRTPFNLAEALIEMEQLALVVDYSSVQGLAYLVLVVLNAELDDLTSLSCTSALKLSVYTKTWLGKECDDSND